MLTRRAPTRDAASARTCSSTQLFQLPHSGHLPSHFVDWLPHSWQAKIVRGPDFTLAFPHRGSLWSSSRSPVTIGPVCDSYVSDLSDDPPIGGGARRPAPGRPISGTHPPLQAG